MTQDAEDPSTWPRRRQVITLDGLLRLIEDNGGARDLDLRGAFIVRVDLSGEVIKDRLTKWHSTPHRRDPLWARLLQSIRKLLKLTHTTPKRRDPVWYSRLTRGLSLSGARLQGAWFYNTKLDDVDLSSADLTGASFWNAEVGRVGDLYDVKSLERTNWYGANLEGGADIRREKLGPAIGDELEARGQARTKGAFRWAREAYSELKSNFRNVSRYEDAAWAYVKERQMAKAMHFPTTAGHRWITKCMGATMPPPWWGPCNALHWGWWKMRSAFYHFRLFVRACPPKVKERMARDGKWHGKLGEYISPWRWFRDWVYELLTGYGERPLNPLSWGALAILGFALGYFLTAIDNFWDALVYSLATFATFNLADPGVQPHGRGMNLASSAEALLGIAVLALVVFTLGNRMSRS